jgi:hypothetical protein
MFHSKSLYSGLWVISFDEKCARVEMVKGLAFMLNISPVELLTHPTRHTTL